MLQEVKGGRSPEGDSKLPELKWYSQSIED